MSVMVGIISRLMADDWTDWMRRIAFDALDTLQQQTHSRGD
jgi:hypothetical protein